MQKYEAKRAVEKEIAARLQRLAACEAERAEAEVLETAIMWSRVEDARRETEAVSGLIAAAEAAKAQAEAVRQAKQAKHDACEEENSSEVRTQQRHRRGANDASSMIPQCLLEFGVVAFV